MPCAANLFPTAINLFGNKWLRLLLAGPLVLTTLWLTSPIVSAQTTSPTEFSSGTLDHSKATAPRWKRVDLDPLSPVLTRSGSSRTEMPQSGLER